MTANIKKGNNTTIWHPEKSVILDCEIGDDCIIHAPVWIGNGVKIGNRCRVQAFCFIPEGVRIEDDAFIGPSVVFTNDKYPPSSREKWGKIVVKQKARIGANTTIVPDVEIGEGALVGAGSVVTRNVKKNTIVYGNPARENGGVTYGRK